MWVGGHLPLAAAVYHATEKATQSPLIGLLAAVASHYVLDAAGPFPAPFEPSRQPKSTIERWHQWLTNHWRLISPLAFADIATAWIAITVVGILTHQSWLFWLGAMMGFWPDVDKALIRLFRIWPLSLLAALHTWTHRYTPNFLACLVWWVSGITASWLLLWLAIRSAS